MTTVDIDEMGPEVTAARIELGTAAGTRQVVGRLADGLALAAAAGAPVRVADPVMDRLAVPVRGGDLLAAIPQQEPVIPRHEAPRRAPRNLRFGDGLAGWHLALSSSSSASPSTAPAGSRYATRTSVAA